MQILNGLLLVLTIIFCGAYAGMTVFCQIGVLPTMRRLSREAYVITWGIMDGFLGRSMPPFKISLLVLNLASATCLFFALHNAHLAAASLASFFLSLAGLVLTVRKQVPLNHRIRTFPSGGDDRLLTEMRGQTERNFFVRSVLAVTAFAVLVTGTVLFPV